MANLEIFDPNVGSGEDGKATHDDYSKISERNFNVLNSEKVEVELGKGLTSNDFTNDDKSKLDGVADEATKNHSDLYLLSRENHTGFQSIDTISGLQYKLYSLELQSAGVTVIPSYTIVANSLTLGDECLCNLYSTTDETALLNEYSVNSKSLDLSAMADGSRAYVSIKLNAGTPEYFLDPSLSADGITEIVAFTVVRLADGYTLQSRKDGLFTSEKLNNRLTKTNVFQRAEVGGGMIVSSPSGNIVNISAGVGFYGLEEYQYPPVSSASDTGSLYTPSGGWDDTITTFNNSQYVDNSGNLQDVGSNKYVINWVYRSISEDTSSKFIITLGSGDYTISEANAESQPLYTTDALQNLGELVGKVIVKKGASSPITIEQVSDIKAGGSSGSTILSVNGKTDENIVLNTDDITEGTVNKYSKSIRRSLIDNPMSHVLQRNKVKTVLNGDITVGGSNLNASYLDQYGILRYPTEKLNYGLHGWLVQKTATNLMYYANDFVNAFWIKNESTIDDSGENGPDLTECKKISASVVNSEHSIEQSVVSALTGQHTASVFVKADDLSIVKLSITSVETGINASAYYDLNSGIVTNNTGDSGFNIESLFDGWYRIQISGNAVNMGTSIVKVNIIETTGVDVFTGTGSNGILVYGVQYESESQASPFINNGDVQLTTDSTNLSIVEPNNTPILNQPFTVSFNVKLEILSFVTLMHLKYLNNNQFRLELPDETKPDELSMVFSEPSNTFYFNLQKPITELQNITITYDSLVLKIYSDSVLVANTNIVYSSLVGVTEMFIGRHATAATRHSTGYYNNVKVWDKVLTQSEIDYITE